jgi:hypothetical protein
MARLTELQLDFTNLAKLDNGRVDRLLRFHLQRIAQDCLSRPGDANNRKVTLEFSVKPMCSPDGECEGVHVEIEAKSKTPVYRTKKYEMRVSNSGLLFNADFPDSINQQSLLHAEDDDDQGEDDGLE